MNIKLCPNIHHTNSYYQLNTNTSQISNIETKNFIFCTSQPHHTALRKPKSGRNIQRPLNSNATQIRTRNSLRHPSKNHPNFEPNRPLRRPAFHNHMHSIAKFPTHTPLHHAMNRPKAPPQRIPPNILIPLSRTHRNSFPHKSILTRNLRIPHARVRKHHLPMSRDTAKLAYSTEYTGTGSIVSRT